MPAANQNYPFVAFSRDLIYVLRGIWVLLLFHALAILSFLFLPQGTDTLLLLLENSFQVGNPWPLLWLLIGIVFWSISSEFCARMLLYMTDNSGHALSIAAVASRKQLQVVLAKYCLYLPLIILAIGLVKAYFQNQADSHFPLGVLLVLLLILLLLSFLLFQLYHANHPWPFARKWMRLSAQEAYWTGKLYGIFNPYRMDLSIGTVLTHQNQAYDLDRLEDLPRNCILPNGVIIPAGFELLTKTVHQQPHPIQTWMFQIPLSFYSSLLKQLAWLSMIALLMILVFAMLPIPVYSSIGAAALVCCSFGSWQLVYCFIKFLDKAQPMFGLKIPYQCLIILWLLFCSYYNQDHPIPFINQAKRVNPPGLQTHFESWARSLENGNSHDSIPIYLIAAEGGALRTGAFTAMVLSKIADQDSSFSKRVYAYSTVSGGSLGAGFFLSIQSIKNRLPQQSLGLASKTFFKADYLSAVTGKLVFAEIMQCFIPWHIARWDRAIALEKSWENGWSNAVPSLGSNHNFQEAVPVSDNSPAVFFQTVEVETGMPCIWSNLNLDGTIPFSNTRDIGNRYHNNIALSTAIHLSARFPLVSPAAMFASSIDGRIIRRHYVDGGYFENSGQANLLELMGSIPFEKHPRLIPTILCFNFSEKDSSIDKGIHFGNELSEILQGIYQTRNARTSFAHQELDQYCQKRFGPGHLFQINLNINTRAIPMNWVLSHTAIQRVDDYSQSLVETIIPFISNKKHQP